MQEECSGLLQQTDAAQTDLHAFDFLGGAVMAEVDQAVSEAMPGACDMGWQQHALAAWCCTYPAARQGSGRAQLNCRMVSVPELDNWVPQGGRQAFALRQSQPAWWKVLHLPHSMITHCQRLTQAPTCHVIVGSCRRFLAWRACSFPGQF